MKIRTIMLAALFLLLSSAAWADAGGEWTFLGYNVNTGNIYISVAAGSDKMLLAFGAENNGQGSTTTVVKRTLDGGTNWGPVQIELYGGFMFMFTDMQMLDEDIGFAAGMVEGFPNPTAGPMWRITNKGAQFEALTVEGFPRCSRLYCLDKERCWATCLEGKIISTVNGGDDWSFQDLPVTDLHPGPIHFIDGRKGWAAFHLTETIEEEGQDPVTVYYDRGTVFKTTNGGDDWTTVSDGEHFGYKDIQFVNSSVGYMGAYDETLGYLLKTTDGGSNWIIQPLLPSVETQWGTMSLFIVGGLKFFDENTGWITTSYGTSEAHTMAPMKFFYTENGARNWSEHIVMAEDQNGNPVEVGGIMSDMVFLDEHLGFAVGDYQMVLKYSDGQYQPPADGDADGDYDGSAGDADVDTGPVYHGEPEEPCPVPGYADSYSIPRCDPEEGATLCAWRDGAPEGAFCTLYCEGHADCKSFGNMEACCRMISIEGQMKGVCLFEDQLCVDYSGEWRGYSNALLGEGCNPPVCDPNYGGVCYMEHSGADALCTTGCVSDQDCYGGFVTEGCCTGYDQANFGGSFCRFDDACRPEPDGDGDTFIPGGDADSPGGSGSAAAGGGGGGCSTAPFGLGAMAWLMALALLRRRRKI